MGHNNLRRQIAGILDETQNDTGGMEFGRLYVRVILERALDALGGRVQDTRQRTEAVEKFLAATNERGFVDLDALMEAEGFEKKPVEDAPTTPTGDDPPDDASGLGDTGYGHGV